MTMTSCRGDGEYLGGVVMRVAVVVLRGINVAIGLKYGFLVETLEDDLS